MWQTQISPSPIRASIRSRVGSESAEYTVVSASRCLSFGARLLVQQGADIFALTNIARADIFANANTLTHMTEGLT